MTGQEAKEYIMLAHAHVNQLTSGGVKSDWDIQANETNESLGKLPSTLNEQQVFAILEFAREHELLAFNEGIILGKDKQKAIDDKIIKQHEEQLAAARDENERLAQALENITKKQGASA